MKETPQQILSNIKSEALLAAFSGTAALMALGVTATEVVQDSKANHQPYIKTITGSPTVWIGASLALIAAGIATLALTHRIKLKKMLQRSKPRFD